jgi:SET domain-containing protein
MFKQENDEPLESSTNGICNKINNNNNPFMIYYKNYIIDSSTSGNISRFIRKSCTPNCHLEHFIENGQIHFIIISTNNIPKGAELTLPYDEIQDFR